MSQHKIKLGMVGGGEGAFIGEVHRYAARIAGNVDLVAGAFSSNPEKSKRSGLALGIAPERTYASFEEMIKTESTLPEDERIDAVSIVTPNHMHYAPSALALEYGFHVICDKPLTNDLEDALKLEKQAAGLDLKFAVTYTYTGYPLVHEAAEFIKNGGIGTPRKIVAEYLQGWLTEPIEQEGQKQASWRVDPKKAGLGGALGDIGVHAANLAETMMGEQITEVAAYLHKVVENRLLDDDGQVMIRFGSGAKGVLNFSQVACGEENDLNIRIYGDKAGIEWHQMEPNTLKIKYQGEPEKTVRAGFSASSDAAAQRTRTPGGHPEGYLEAFGNIYLNFANDIIAQKSGNAGDAGYPELAAGVQGMKLIQACADSNNNNNTWTKVN